MCLPLPSFSKRCLFEKVEVDMMQADRQAGRVLTIYLILLFLKKNAGDA